MNNEEVVGLMLMTVGGFILFVALPKFIQGYGWKKRLGWISAQKATSSERLHLFISLLVAIGFVILGGIVMFK